MTARIVARPADPAQTAPAADAAPDLAASALAGVSGLPIHDCDILVVDDIEWNRVLIGGLLQGSGFERIRFAIDGNDALAKIVDRPPDLVLLDIMMPGLNGFETCRRLREDPDYAPFADIPVLMQTALTGIEDRRRAFEAGTTDFVSKPLDRAEMLARVRIHLENRLLIRNLKQFRARLEAELDMARAVYRHLLPTPAALGALAAELRLEVRARLWQSGELGGNLWGVHRLPGGRVGVYLLEIDGHGVSAALNACRLHTLIQDLVDQDAPPELWLKALNREACDAFVPGEQASMVYGVIDPGRGRLDYAGAGTGPVVVVPDTAPRPEPEVPPPLGVSPDRAYQRRTLAFPPTAGLLLLGNNTRAALTGPDGGAAPSAAIGDAEPVPSEGFVADLAAAAASDRGGSLFDRLEGRISRIAAAVGAEDPRTADDHILVWAGPPQSAPGTADAA